LTYAAITPATPITPMPLFDAALADTPICRYDTLFSMITPDLFHYATPRFLSLHHLSPLTIL